MSEHLLALTRQCADAMPIETWLVAMILAHFCADDGRLPAGLVEDLADGRLNVEVEHGPRGWRLLILGPGRRVLADILLVDRLAQRRPGSPASER
jgi:hypothetical protein